MRHRRKNPPARVRLRPAPLPGAAPFFTAARPWKSLAVGVAGAIAVHGFLLAVLPERLSPLHEESERNTGRLTVTLPSPSEEDAPEPPPEEYVATNPDVPSNRPDEARHFASRDQQAAQEEAPEDEAPENTPRIEGEELRSQNIVEGHPDPEFPAGGVFAREEDNADGFPSIPERRPIPDFETEEPDPDETGVHIASTEDENDPGEDAERIVGINIPDDQRQQGNESNTYAAVQQRPQPAPRPTLPRTPSGPIAERAGNTSRVGTVSIDARRSEFGTYLERMLEVIERQWHSLARAHFNVSDTGSRVRVRFELDSSGHVEMLDIQSSASHTGTLICQDAIESRAPFGDWSDEMIEVLGDKQTMSITFHYR